MLEQFTIDTFAGRSGETFRLTVQGADPIDVTLDAVREIPVAGWRPSEAAEHRQPFSLTFLGPGAFILPQAIYGFEHPEIGSFEMFIVPIGRDARGVSYEAVFS